jgi:hypothetical protein
MKFLYFDLLLWVKIFALLDPDPDSEYGSGSDPLTWLIPLVPQTQGNKDKADREDTGVFTLL